MVTERKTYVIAEAGVNHNGSAELAMRLIDVAAEAGASAVKFQTFQASELASRSAKKAEYQLCTTDGAQSQLDMLRALELSEDLHEALVAHAAARGIRFLSTPFDLHSLRLLSQRFGLDTIKIPSGEITNAPFLIEIARVAKHVILSTGMSTISEIEGALGALAYGWTVPNGERPCQEAFVRAFSSNDGQKALRERVTLLHCTTEYPAPFGEVNLRAMDTLARAFGLRVGYSDHTPGIHVAIAAVACGAVLVEKHFTLDRDLPGPDHKASLEPEELRAMVSAIRDVESALGDGIKRPSPAEWKNRNIARKSLVALKAIGKGEVFSPENIGCKRPGLGLSPVLYWDILGTISTRAYGPDEVIS
ncbi:MAG: N-acetylneuraminate synthase [Alphaproteobacteria bacterium]|nr:N-acetylneuraminate synthase [Alphaproteobacteria bacterium]